MGGANDTDGCLTGIVRFVEKSHRRSGHRVLVAEERIGIGSPQRGGLALAMRRRPVMPDPATYTELVTPF